MLCFASKQSFLFLFSFTFVGQKIDDDNSLTVLMLNRWGAKFYIIFSENMHGHEGRLNISSGILRQRLAFLFRN